MLGGTKVYMPRKINREGEITKDKNGTNMKIIKYKNYDDIFVEFLDEYHAVIHSDYDRFKRKVLKTHIFHLYMELGI